MPTCISGYRRGPRIGRELEGSLAGLKKIKAFDSEIASGKHEYPSVNLSAMSDQDVTTFLEPVDKLTGATREELVAEVGRLTRDVGMLNTINGAIRAMFDVADDTREGPSRLTWRCSVRRV